MCNLYVNKDKGSNVNVNVNEVHYMEELMMFDKNEQRLMDAGLIAVSLVILQVWVSSGIHDTASLISLIAFSVSLPMIALDLMFNHTSLIFSKIDWYLDDS